MEKCDILIIGAGAAGLMAAFKLSEKGRKVIVLEARDRTGGRIHTIQDKYFFDYAELGAEFIHGDLPVTLKLLEEAGLGYSRAGGKMVNYAEGKFKDDGGIEQWGLLLKKLNELKEDISLTDFLNRYFPEAAYEKLRNSIKRYVSGYDTADVAKASSFALRKEWENEDEDAQHRIDTGYCSMIRYLADRCRQNGGEICLDLVVKEIIWKPGSVKAVTVSGVEYNAEKMIIALPLGVLQAAKHETGAVTFHPAITEQTAAINSLGFGAIIKFLLEFDEAFWENDHSSKLAGKSLKEMAFLLSDEEIPTWWTQHPQRSKVLTGWLGGPAAAAKKDMSNEALLQQGMESLSNIFKIELEELKDRLVAGTVVNWTAEPFTRGSYSYDTIAAPGARKLLNEPVKNTLYFTGEYLYDGTAMGTVEAALTSALNVVEAIDK